MKKINIYVVLVFAMLFCGINVAQNVEKTYKVTPGTMVELFVEIGSIEVSTGNANEVKLVIENAEGDESDLQVTESSKKLQIRYNNRDEHFDSECSLVVPKQSNLTLKTAAGNITINNDINGSIDLNTSGGNIDFNNVTGIVEVHTSGGNINGGNIDSDAEINTSGGMINVGDLGGKAELFTSGGNVSVGNVVKEAKIKTSGGNIIVGNVGGDAELKTAGGNISIRNVEGNVEAKTAGGNINVNSAVGKVDVRTAGGNLILSNITGSIDAKTAAGSIQAELNPNNNGRSELSTSVGDLFLTIPSDAKATIEVTIITHDWSWDEEDLDVDDYLKVNFEPETIDIKNGKIEAVYKLNGGGHFIEMETYMGKIEITKK